MKKFLCLTMSMAYLALPALALAKEGNAEAGKQKAQVCASCHGPGGHSQNAQFPILAGQYQDYLFYAIKAYKTGERQNPIMKGMVANLSDDDIADLAAYFAREKGLMVKNYSEGSGNKSK